MSDPFAAAGALREAYRQTDWAATALGPVTSWSPALRTAVDLMVRSRAAATLLWGPQFVLLYNEAYVPILEEKHPWALGRPAQVVFPEIWPDIEPLLASVYAGRDAVWLENLRLLLRRHGRLEESYFTFSYSAVAGPDGAIEGVLDIVIETTAQFVAFRRLTVLARLVNDLADLDTHATLVDRALTVLRSADDDLAGADIHLSATAAGASRWQDVELAALGDRRTVSVRFATGDGVLTLRLHPHVIVDRALRQFLELITAALEQGLTRIRSRTAERRNARLEREMSEALQLSLLTTPVRHDRLQVAVRYQAAAEQVQVGGDWYDSFLSPGGNLTVVVGDVTGHDRHSAAAMAQIRNLTRGICHALAKPPAEVLETLDRAMSGLAVNMHATAILAELLPGPGPRAWTLRWSNAGHPPPVLLRPDGSVRLLETVPEILLGTRVQAKRRDHSIDLEPGCSVLFYTDGLVERRRAGLDDGIAKVLALLTGRRDDTAEQLCDLLLARFGHNTEDDIALAVVQT